jgi:hypothetical protein
MQCGGFHLNGEQFPLDRMVSIASWVSRKGAFIVHFAPHSTDSPGSSKPCSIRTKTSCGASLKIVGAR